jgi:hypothetical protein
MTTLVRVAFRHGDDRAFSRVVTFFRGGDSAHCEAAHAWSGSEHECVSSSFVDGGLRPKKLDLPKEKWRIYEVPAAEHPLEYIKRRSVNGRIKYDVWGLLGVLWPRLGHSVNREFCVETCGAIIGLQEPHLFDLRTLENVCQLIGRRVQ